MNGKTNSFLPGETSMNDFASGLRCSKVAIDRATIGKDATLQAYGKSSYSFSHTLGEVPKFVFILSDTIPSFGYYENKIFNYVGTAGGTGIDYTTSGYSDTAIWHNITTVSISSTATKITCTNGTATASALAANTYTIITMA